MIIGIDEVGRGSWAGPVVVAAVGLGGTEIEGLTDSKKLTKKKRETFSYAIKHHAPLIGIGWVSARDIDKIGMSAALQLAARRSLMQLNLEEVSQIIIDGTLNLLADLKTHEITMMKQADLLVPSVSAASVIAKVARDKYMSLCETIFPGYGFHSHVGYGTRTHQQAINELGASPIHRMSFSPLSNVDVTVRIPNFQNSTTSVGNRAETEAIHFLEHNGYKIIARNWKTKWCEIDIIARKEQRTHFVEVKYRRNTNQGGGIAAITPSKLRQMKFAAELWLQKYGSCDALLSAIEVTGDMYTITRYEERV